MAPVVSIHDRSNSAELTTPYSTKPVHRCNQYGENGGVVS
ncbi:hypothetical protein T4C_10044 [Trichinella pseudospiralis]|uniref:Uncharacterized protein n=1 Tax=Trichinella pseudospiralis TaxID=6337 RepID=A0A0V1GHI2_TRIPS|nr:hypothetical protein T4C_10044 [Trichinella pseudospiralis]